MVASLDSLVDARAFVQSALARLREAPETTNPALVLYLRLTRQDDLSLAELVRLESRLTEARCSAGCVIYHPFVGQMFQRGCRPPG